MLLFNRASHFVIIASMIDIPDSIFPKDEQGNMLCPKCLKGLKDCVCPSFEPPKPKAKRVNPMIRLDKSGRRGKLVTVIRNLPNDEPFLKDLAKTLKVKTGSGGTSYLSDEGGVVEIQGDHRAVLANFFSKKSN